MRQADEVGLLVLGLLALVDQEAVVVTVFKGVKIEYEGTFYTNVDVREFGRRPWDGRADPKPNSKGNLTGYNYIYYLATGSVPPVALPSSEKSWPINRTIPPAPTETELQWYKEATDLDGQFGYDSAISFKKNDNSRIPAYRPWAPDPFVTMGLPDN